MKKELIDFRVRFSDATWSRVVQFMGSFEEEGFDMVAIVASVNQVTGKTLRGFMVISLVGVL